MKHYKVYGSYIATITKEVDAESEDEAIEKAYNEFCGVEDLVTLCVDKYGHGNYVNNKIGVGDGGDEEIWADGTEQWEYTEEEYEF